MEEEDNARSFMLHNKSTATEHSVCCCDKHEYDTKVRSAKCKIVHITLSCFEGG